jgi:predicted TPR repeat methyltransferase
MSKPAHVAGCEALLARCAAGELSPEIALLQLLMACGDPGLVAELVRGHQPSPRLARIASLLERHASGCARVTNMLSWVTAAPPAGASPDTALAFWRALFDRAAEASEEASVALYSMGSSELLGAATDELVGVLDAWGRLARDGRVLDLGCGIGRVTRALAGRVARVDGVDVSENMLAAARRRCADLPNVRFWRGSGSELTGCADGGYELVLAVDSFPFVVSLGEARVDAMFAEIARVTAADGSFALFNYSYRGELARDVRELRQLSRRHGFALTIEAARPFALWDGTAFLLTKAPTTVA